MVFGGFYSFLPPGCGSAEMGCVNGPCSLSFSPGPLEYFALLVRTSGPVLLGLSRKVQGLFRKSVSGWSAKGGRLILRRRLADYQARPTPSGVRSREKDERRPWLGTVGAQWSRVPSS